LSPFGEYLRDNFIFIYFKEHNKILLLPPYGTPSRLEEQECPWHESWLSQAILTETFLMVFFHSSWQMLA
jgi:hypothetical protein